MWRGLLAWLGLALAALVILWPLGLTNRVLAGVDALTYFTPYWAYRMAELRAGHLPLWNPYLFLGVPFLANPQAAVLYPLHWPLSWLRPEQALVWSALLHAWLAAGFTYTFGRRSLRLSRPAAWLAGLIFGLGGFTLARVENINQLNTLAWLPALLWTYDEAARADSWRSRIRWMAALTIVIALTVLAGHTQTAFVNLVGLGIWVAWPVLRMFFSYTRGIASRHHPRNDTTDENLSLHPPSLTGKGDGGIGRAIFPLLAVLPALLICAAQLLPTLELNGLGLRTGGLPFRQAVSFSLKPRLLAQSLLPPFGGGLAQAFGSEGYAEFVGYVGIVGLILACIGVTAHWMRRGETTPRTTHHVPGERLNVQRATLLAAIGFLLALGAYNPLYYLLWRFIPGFDLFRAPARWLELFALGAAILAGWGLDAFVSDAAARRHGGIVMPARRRWGGLSFARREHASRERSSTFVSAAGSKDGACRRWITRIVSGIVAVTLAGLIFIQQRPSWTTLAGWAAVALATAGLLWAGHCWRRAARAGLIVLAFAELWLGGRALPFTEATAPSATGLRNAPAALLAATNDQPRAGRDRFLSMSDIRFDPGDLAELRATQADRLPPDAAERLVRAAKQVEVIAPNLSLLYRLPAVDGYDGGLLPLGRYVKLENLFLPPEQLMPDGRLREQLTEVPADRLLDLTGVRFIITDKQRDLWADDVYYDLELPARLEPGQALTLDLSAYPPFSATALGVVAEAANDVQDGVLLADLEMIGTDGRSIPLALHAGPQTRETPAPERLRMPAPTTPVRITVRVPPAAQAMTLRGMSLIDERTGAHSTVTVSQQGNVRRIHSGDVKIYERLGAPGRAWLVHGILPEADDAAALAALADPAFDPRSTVVVADSLDARPAAAAAANESVAIVSYEPQQVVLRADAARPGVLVLADTFYPGWQATVDGVQTPILRANLAFRGIALEPGQHQVIFTYQPASWMLGARISLIALALLAATPLATAVRPLRKERASQRKVADLSC